MEEERRRAKRVELNVTIILKSITSSGMTVTRELPVQVVNISRSGIAFKTTEELEMGTYYDTHIKMTNSESFEAVIEIVRHTLDSDGEMMYGCRFIGMNSENQFKIDVYQIIQEHMKKEE